jgi:hypothetical protein
VAGGHPAPRAGPGSGRGGPREVRPGHRGFVLRAGLDDRVCPRAGTAAAGRRSAADTLRGGRDRLRRQRAVGQCAHRRSRARRRLHLPGTRPPPDQAPRGRLRAGRVRRAVHGLAGADRGHGTADLRQPGGCGPRAAARHSGGGRARRRTAERADTGVASAARAHRRRRRPGGSAAAPQVRRTTGAGGGQRAAAARRPALAPARLGHGRRHDVPELATGRRLSLAVHPRGRGGHSPPRPAVGLVGRAGGGQHRPDPRRDRRRGGGARGGPGRRRAIHRESGGRGHDLPADQPVASGRGRLDHLLRPAVPARQTDSCGNAVGFTSGFPVAFRWLTSGASSRRSGC